MLRCRGLGRGGGGGEWLWLMMGWFRSVGLGGYLVLDCWVGVVRWIGRAGWMLEGLEGSEAACCVEGFLDRWMNRAG